jgi:hypothetical protein
MDLDAFDVAAAQAACSMADRVRAAASANDVVGVAAKAAAQDYADKVRDRTHRSKVSLSDSPSHCHIGNRIPACMHPRSSI